jgi:hypothetical protein
LEPLGEALHVVRGEDEEHAVKVELHVLEDGFDDAAGGAAVGVAGGLSAGEQSVHFVDPHDARGVGLGRKQAIPRRRRSAAFIRSPLTTSFLEKQALGLVIDERAVV